MPSAFNPGPASPVNPADFQPGQEVSAEVARELCQQEVPVQFRERSVSQHTTVHHADSCAWHTELGSLVYVYRVSPNWPGVASPPPPVAQEPQLIPMSEMEPGQVGVLREAVHSSYTGAVVMRLVRPAVVVLQPGRDGHPRRGDEWSDPVPSSIRVQLLNITFDGIDP